jgi:hypothetical protein
MKKIISYSLLLCLMAVVMYSCKPDNDFKIGQPQNRLQQLAGTWKLQSVIQTDINAKNNNYVDDARQDVNVQQMDITSAAPFTDLKLTFAEGANNVPTTFAVDYGGAPKIFKNASGIWLVDDLATPGAIKFVNGTDTINLRLGNVSNLSANMLTLTRIKSQGTKPKIQYDYNFIKL